MNALLSVSHELLIFFSKVKRDVMESRVGISHVLLCILTVGCMWKCKRWENQRKILTALTVKGKWILFLIIEKNENFITLSEGHTSLKKQARYNFQFEKQCVFQLI